METKKTLTGLSNKQLVAIIAGGMVGAAMLFSAIAPNLGPELSRPTQTRDWNANPLTMSECISALENAFNEKTRGQWIDFPPTRREFAGVCRNQYGVR